MKNKKDKERQLKALDYEINKTKEQFEECFLRLVGILSDSRNSDKVKEVVRRLLVSTVITDAMGNYGNKTGYVHPGWDENSPIERMAFVSFFVDHELLDDGDPGIGYYTFNEGGFVDCPPDTPHAKPYFHNCCEILGPGGKHLYEDDVIEILDWHEKWEKERYEFFKEFQDQREPPPTENPILVSLLEDIETVVKRAKGAP